MDAIRVALRFAPKAKELFPGSEVWLFGSHAKGYATESSDIDIAVLLADYPKEWSRTDIIEKRALLEAAAADTDDRIEAVVRTCQDRSGFVKNIFDTGIYVC